METDNDAIPRIASLFAGGIGNTGSVCGAVIGAVMAMSLRQEKVETIEEMLANFAVAGEFRSRFEEKMGSINCSELVGMDMSTVEGVEKFMESDKPQTVCFPAVGAAYQIVVDMLK